MTPFGRPVEPDVYSSLAIVAGPTRMCAASTADEAAVPSSSSNNVDAKLSVSQQVTTSDGRTAFRARSKGCPSAAKTRPGLSASQSARNVVKSRATREYDGATGTYMIPAYIAPSARMPCSMLLPDRITTGRSFDRPRLRSDCATLRTRRNASAYVSVRHSPPAGRSARNTRSGASRAQCSRRSVIFDG